MSYIESFVILATFELAFVRPDPISVAEFRIRWAEFKGTVRFRRARVILNLQPVKINYDSVLDHVVVSNLIGHCVEHAHNPSHCSSRDRSILDI